MSDWTGNTNSIFATHGASNHSDTERADLDYYATDPEAVEALLTVEDFSHFVWEPACGGCHISEVLVRHGFSVMSTDIVDRGSVRQDGKLDFLKTVLPNRRDIITNPPYKFAAEFVKQALDISADSVKVAMFLKLTFLESKKRKQLFDMYPPERIYVFRDHVDCWKNGVKPKKSSKAVCYAWFVWVKGFDGSPEIHWI